MLTQTHARSDVHIAEPSEHKGERTAGSLRLTDDFSSVYPVAGCKNTAKHKQTEQIPPGTNQLIKGIQPTGWATFVKDNKLVPLDGRINCFVNCLISLANY